MCSLASSPAPAPAVAPAVTSATASSDAELHEAIAFFLDHTHESITFTRAEGGVNNKCSYVTVPDAAAASGPPRPQYVLRIYNNGGNTDRVRYEHAVLRELAAHNQFSFALPVPLPILAHKASSEAGATQGTIALLKSGASACLFPCIPGGPADASSPAVARAIGRASAELVRGMSGLRIDLPLPNPLYRNMYDAHHAIAESSFSALITGPRCDHVRAAASDLMHEMSQCQELISKIMDMSPPLPEQQVHADLHVANVLIGTTHDDEADSAAPAADTVGSTVPAAAAAAAAVSSASPIVTGVLDFEFSAVDWRVMELVVGLSKYIATPAAETCFEAYVAGYAEGGGRLTAAESQYAPDLIIVRVLNNVIYFAGRALAGEDDLAALTTRMDMYAARCKWIRDKAAWMRAVLRAQLVEAAAAAADSQ